MLKGRKTYRYFCFVLSAAMLLSVCTPGLAYAGTWTKASAGWMYEKDGGGNAVSEFVTDNGEIYYLNNEGVMPVGWHLLNGKWFFFNTSSNKAKPEGAMLTGWQWIDGRCYFLSQENTAAHPYGSMYCSEQTPDGYQVDSTGAWTENGKAVEVPGKGISTKAPSMAAGTVKISGGGGGGGGSSSGGGNSSSYRPVKRETGKEEIKVKDEEKPSEELVPKEEEKPIDTGEDDVTVDITEPEEEEEEKIPEATPSEAEEPDEPNDGDEDIDVAFEIRFVDSDNFAKELAKRRNGTAKNGSLLQIGYTNTIRDAAGNVWTALEPSHDEILFGPGPVIIYIEYELTQTAPEEEDPYKDEKEALASWIQTAKEADAEITGEEPEDIFDEREVCATLGAAQLRLKGLADQILDNKEHEIYVIGKNIDPNGIILKECFAENVNYARDVLDTITIDEDAYTVTRFIVKIIYSQDDCDHNWVLKSEKDATCLKKGTKRYECDKCYAVKTVTVASLGHTDGDGDSVCDRCRERVYEQNIGDQINAVLMLHDGEAELTFTLVDDDYQDGMLYVADEGIPAGEIGLLDNADYKKTELFGFFSSHFGNDFSINGDNLLKISADGTNADAALLSLSEAKAYAEYMGGDYVTRTYADGGYKVLLSDGAEETCATGDGETLIRPAIVLTKPDAGDPVRNHYSEGDVIEREIDGVTYAFRCIDEDYSDKLSNLTVSALFLCESVIPAGYKGEYKEEVDETGHLKDVWVPGPVARYGQSNDYKYSDIRAFLDAETVFDAADIQIGVSNSFTGSTKSGKFEQLDASGLRTYDIGYQKMNARLFILSVDEALKYVKYLWTFDGIFDPDSQVSDTCKAYWLRSPCGAAADYDETGLCYVVDLVNGNIRPMEVMPEGGSGDAYVDTQTAVGVRPCFTLPQR